MEMIHMDTKFKNVSETLLITLNARGKDADSPNSVLNDKKSAEIMSRIDYTSVNLIRDGCHIMEFSQEQKLWIRK